MEKITECPICKTQNFTSFISCIDYLVSRELFQIERCTFCGFLFTNPRPNQEEIGKYYESSKYISHTNSSKGIFNKAYQFVRDYSIKKKRTLVESFNLADKKLLDIGCGTGEFLNSFKNTGWTTKGLEPSKNARQHAISNYGLDIDDISTLFSISPKSFSVITMWHVLEHVHELSKYVIKLHNILQDNGFLIIAVPNPESYDAKLYGNKWAAYDVPRHLNHFSIKTMKLLMESNGFSIKNIIPMKFDSYYVSMLSEQNKGNGIIKMGIKGLLNGFFSNTAGFNDIVNYSSLIYLIQKENLVSI